MAKAPLWTLAEVAASLGLDADTIADAPVTGISIDSRTLVPGDLFFAIVGDRNDGHAFVSDALAKGAAAAVVFRKVDGADGPCIVVNDTLVALNMLGEAGRARTSAAVAAVTGSVGKTGTKEMLRLMLAPSGATHASEKSYNNQWGVPLSLARMPKETAFGIFEIGMNHSGEITPLSALVRPHAALITWVGPVHMAFFASEAEIADAKAEIFAGVERQGAAVLPVDNPHFERLARHAHARGLRVYPFGEGSLADSRILSIEADGQGSAVTATVLGERVNFFLRAPGRHLCRNAVGALSLAKILGGDVRRAAEALAEFSPSDGRGGRSLVPLKDGALLLIDETYNANPASMRASLQVLGETPREAFPRRVAALGDMLELGQNSAAYHADLAEAIDAFDTDVVFCAGPLMANLYKCLPSHKQGGYAEASEQLRPLLLAALKAGDVVMIKGSLGSRMGLLADAVRRDLPREVSCLPNARITEG